MAEVKTGASTQAKIANEVEEMPVVLILPKQR